MDISEIISHEEYDSATVNQDFALLRMANKVDLNHHIFVMMIFHHEYFALLRMANILS